MAMDLFSKAGRSAFTFGVNRKKFGQRLLQRKQYSESTTRGERSKLTYVLYLLTFRPNQPVAEPSTRPTAEASSRDRGGGADASQPLLN
jgi:hypothetical protein